MARVPEIAILSMRFAIKHSFQKNSLLHCPLKRVLALQKEFPVLVARVSEIEILLKIIRCNAFLSQEFSLLFNLVSRISILLERITIKMIVLIRSLILKRRICYLGNLECLHFLRFLCYLLGVKQSKVARCTANNSITVQHLKDQVSKTTLPLQDVIYIVNIIVIFEGNS